MIFTSKADPGIGRESAPVGSRAWAEHVRLSMQGLVSSVRTKPEGLRFYIDLIKEHQAWTLMNKDDGSFFKTFEEFCEYRQPWGLGHAWPKLRPFIVAVCNGNEAQAAAVTTSPGAAPTHSDAAKAQPRTEDGRKLAGKSVGSYPNQLRGETSAYLAARIARDAPAIHERMKAGEFSSVRAAAKEAGLVKDADPVKVAVRALKKVPAERMGEVVSIDVKNMKTAIRRLTADEQAEIYSWLAKELGK